MKLFPQMAVKFDINLREAFHIVVNSVFFVEDD